MRLALVLLCALTFAMPVAAQKKQKPKPEPEISYPDWSSNPHPESGTMGATKVDPGSAEFTVDSFATVGEFPERFAGRHSWAGGIDYKGERDWDSDGTPEYAFTLANQTGSVLVYTHTRDVLKFITDQEGKWHAAVVDVNFARIDGEYTPTWAGMILRVRFMDENNKIVATYP